jgi:hypothetical protein
MCGIDYKCIQNCCQKTPRPSHMWTYNDNADRNELAVNWIHHTNSKTKYKHVVQRKSTVWFSKN